jgi:hypothetical protein
MAPYAHQHPGDRWGRPHLGVSFGTRDGVFGQGPGCHADDHDRIELYDLSPRFPAKSTARSAAMHPEPNRRDLGFKIYEDGLSSDLEWAVTRLIDNKGLVDFTIPSCIADGEYVLPPLLRLLFTVAFSTFPTVSPPFLAPL